MSATRSPITTHVLDTSRGKAAANVAVQLERRMPDGDWRSLRNASTNTDGRVEDLLPPGSKVEPGWYRLTFDTQAYYAGAKTFYPFVSIVFEITQSAEHYHVPLLLNPFGYTTYRGT